MAGVLSSSNQETLSALSVRLTHEFKPGFMEQLNEFSPIWQSFRKTRGRGDQSRWKTHVGRNDGAGFTTEAAAIGTAGSQEYINMAHTWAIAQVPVRITDFARAINIGIGHSGIELWRDEIRRSAKDMAQLLEKSLNLAQTGDESLGLPDFLNDGSDDATAIGGQNYADYPVLRSCYIPDTNFATNEARMDALESCIVHGTGVDIAGAKRIFAKEDQGGGQVDFWITTPTIEEALKNTLIANNRWIFTDTLSGNKGMPDQSLGVRRVQGQPRLTHNGKPILASRFSDASKIYAIDASTWEIQILPHQMNAPGFTRLETDFAFIVLAKTGSFIKAYWEIYLQLVNTSPHMNGVVAP